MHALICKVEAGIRQRGLIKAGEGALVAVSGGVDSMVLLRVMHTLALEHGWRLTVAHYNHRLRGAASEGDARFVTGTARRLGLECLVEGGDVRGVASAKGWSVEMAARELRHEFLARTARRLGLNTVALAHHADDQVELFFLRVLRGAGGGLAGMKWRSASPAGKSVTLIRPLLDQPKAALLEFAREEKVRFREDGSNASVDFLRNRVRLELLPLLRRDYQPALDRTVLRTMEIVGEEMEFAQEAARGWLRRKSRGAFTRLPVAVQRQCMCMGLARLKVAAEFELVERLRLQPGVKHSCQNGWLVREGRSGAVSLELAASAEESTGMHLMELRSERGAMSLDGVDVNWKISPHAPRVALGGAKNRERFDADRVGSRVVLRHWQPGDRFQPIGMTQAVKLQDLFTNAKIPARDRHRLLVAEAGDGRIFWVEGLRISEAFKLTGTTRSELHWHWRRAVARA